MRHGHQHVARWLVSAGASVDVVTDEGVRPIWHACSAGELELAAWLHEVGDQRGVLCRRGEPDVHA